MKINYERVLDYCIDTGIEFGLNRAYKHDDTPSRQHIEECIKAAIDLQLNEFFDFTRE